MKKIAIVNAGFLPLPPVKDGAVETLTHFLIQENEEEQAVEFTVISCPDPDAEQAAKQYRNAKFVFVKHPKWQEATAKQCNRVLGKIFPFLHLQLHPYLYRIVRALRGERFDYVLLENWPFYVPYLRKKIDAPIVLHMHNDYFDSSVFMAKEILSSCQTVLGVSEYVKRCVLTIDENAQNVSVLKNVIDVPRFAGVSPQIREEMRKQYGFSEDEIVFAFFGRLIPEKGIKEAVTAFSKLCGEKENVRLLVVGANWFYSGADTDYTSEVKAIAEPWKDRIIFSGYAEYAQIQKQYACADVCLFHSVCEEAAGMVAIEAMASGKPLIVSDSGGISEYVTPDCACIVPRGEGFTDGLYQAMAHLAEDAALRETMGKSGSETALLYDKKNYLRDFMAHLTE